MTTLAFPTGFTMRSVTEGDQEAVVELFIAHERHFYGTAEMSPLLLLADLNTAWCAENIDLEKDALVALSPSDQIVGYVMTYRAPEEPQTIIASPIIMFIAVWIAYLFGLLASGIFYSIASVLMGIAIIGYVCLLLEEIYQKRKQQDKTIHE